MIRIRVIPGDNEQEHIDNLKRLQDQTSKELQDAIATNAPKLEVSQLYNIKNTTALLLEDLLSKQKRWNKH